MSVEQYFTLFMLLLTPPEVQRGVKSIYTVIHTVYFSSESLTPGKTRYCFKHLPGNFLQVMQSHKEKIFLVTQEGLMVT